MSTGGRAASRRCRLVAAISTVLVLAACASGGDSDLEERVAELEEENVALREQLAERAAGAESPPTSAPPEPGDSTPSSSSTTTSTTTTEPGPVRGTREHPIRVGRPVRSGDWVYRVLAFEPNVDSVVTELDAGNEPAGEGRVYARLRLRAVYRGEGAGDPRRLTINLVSPSGRSIGEASICCRPGRDALNDQAETFSGGAVEGWIYYAVAAEDAFGGKFLAFDPDGDVTGVPGGIGFFRVN
jgi:hypothetical protein